MKNLDVTEEQEETMVSAAMAMASLCNLMMAGLPEHAQDKVAGLIGKGARLAVCTVLIPSPVFTLLLLSPNEADEPVELAWCSPSEAAIRLLQTSAVAH